MELIKSTEEIVNQNGAKIAPFVTPPEVESFSLVEVVVDENGHGVTKTTHADRIIEVIKGEGVVIIDERQTQVGPGAICLVPKGIFYDYYSSTTDTLTVRVFDVPKFDPRYEISKD